MKSKLFRSSMVVGILVLLAALTTQGVYTASPEGSLWAEGNRPVEASIPPQAQDFATEAAEVSSEGPAAVYTYDDAGRLIKVEYSTGTTITYSYDAAGNMLRREISVMPDLVITDTWVCWPANCTICYNMTNIGIGTAPAGHNTTLYVDGIEKAQDQVPVDLAPGESYIGCFDDYSWAYTPPRGNITVCADNNETVDESDEGNNCLTNIWKCGDVDGNGYITTWDVGLLNARRWDPSFVINEWAGDVDGNGYITTWDVGLLNARRWDPSFSLSCKCQL